MEQTNKPNGANKQTKKNSRPNAVDHLSSSNCLSASGCETCGWAAWPIVPFSCQQQGVHMSSSISAKEGVDESICVEQKIKPRTIDLLKLSWALARRIHMHDTGKPRRVAALSVTLSIVWPCSVGPWGGRGRGGWRVSKHSPTILTAGRPEMCEKEQKRKVQMDGGLFNISPGWKVKLLLCSCIGLRPSGRLSRKKTNSNCVRASLLGLSCHVNVMWCKFRW